MKRAQDYVSSLIASVMSKHPMGLCLQKWPDIVGKNLSTFVMPQKIIFSKHPTLHGELHLVAPNAIFAAEARMEYSTIKRRVNSFFKRQLIESLRIKHVRCDKAVRIFGESDGGVNIPSVHSGLTWMPYNTTPDTVQKTANDIQKNPHIFEKKYTQPPRDAQNALDTIEDHELKQALESLGRHIFSSHA